MDHGLHEERESLWRLAAAPLIWAAHLLLSYCSAAIFCAKLPDGSFDLVRGLIGGFTVAALAAIGLIGFRGYRRHRYGDVNTTHDFDTPADRHRFLGFATLLLSGLSAVAVIYQGLPALFIRSCQ